MNTPRKIARERPRFGVKCRVCDADISENKHRVDLFGPKSQTEGVLECLQRFLPGEKLHEDDGLSRHICRSCELKILAFLKKEQELKTLFLATESTNRSHCEGERFKRGRERGENCMNMLNIDRSPPAAQPEKRSKPTKIILAPKFNYKPPSYRIDLMSRFPLIKPAPQVSSPSKITSRLAPKFNAPLPTQPNKASSSSDDTSNSTNTSVSCASFSEQTLPNKKRVLPNLFQKQARSTDMEKGAEILNNVMLHKVQ